MEETGIIRNDQGQYVKGVSGNPEGRPPDTLETKLIRKATKEIIQEYTDALAEALPSISPVLIKKAIDGDLGSIKEINDRVLGKPDQKSDITSNGKTINVLVPQAVADSFNINETNQETGGSNQE